METKPGDIVLIHHRGQPAVYARVEEITADVKADWWQVRLLLLQVPRQEITWILREQYIDGGEFTMSGDPIHLERLAPPGGLGQPSPLPPETSPPPGGGGGKVVTLDRKRRGGN